MQQKIRSQNYSMNGIGNSFIILFTMLFFSACQKQSLDGSFYFVNNSSKAVTLSCFGWPQVNYRKNILPSETVRFSDFLFNSHYSIPNQIDSIIIESEGKNFIESCPFRSLDDGGFPARECVPGERSLFNHKAYERVEKRRSLAKDYYYYFTDADLERLK